MWEKVQLTVNKDKSFFPAWRNIAEERAPWSSLIPCTYLPFPLLLNVPRRWRRSIPTAVWWQSWEMTGCWGGWHCTSLKAKKKKIPLGGNEVSITETARVGESRWMRLGNHIMFTSLTFLICLLWGINEITCIKCLTGRPHWEKQFPSLSLGRKGNGQNRAGQLSNALKKEIKRNTVSWIFWLSSYLYYDWLVTSN